MASMKDLSLWTRTALKVYPWRRIKSVSSTRLQKPASDCRVALVSTAGLALPGDPPFDETVKGGDYSYRIIPSDADVQSLVDSHRSDSYDHAGIEKDGNLAFPLERLHALRANGDIGSVAPRHLSFMGSITAPGRLVKRTAPKAAEMLLEDQVDLALLVPV